SKQRASFINHDTPNGPVLYFFSEHVPENPCGFSIAAQSFFEVFCQLVRRPVLLVLCLLFLIPFVLLLQTAIDAQFGIRVGVCGTTKTGVALIIQGTILQAKVTNEGPNLGVVPIDNGMNANKIWPATICTIEMGQVGTM